MKKCCIRGCNSNSRENDEGLSFFRFPRNEALQNLWKDNIGTENIKPFKVVRVCSKHFEDNCINRTLDSVRLKDDVVPTLFPFTSSSRCSSSSGKPRGALAMNIAGNTTALLPFTSSSRCSSSSGKPRGALAMNIAGNTTALLPFSSSSRCSSSSGKPRGALAMNIAGNTTAYTLKMTTFSTLQIVNMIVHINYF